MTADTFDYSGFYTIILTEHTDDCQETITKILADCWTHYITNVNVLTPTEDYETILLYTYFPYTSEYCELVRPIVHDFFENDTFLSDAELFPDKFQNFYQCPLLMSTYNFPPFMILNKTNGTYCTDGLEGKIFRTMAKRLNFTPITIKSSHNMFGNVTDRRNDSNKLRRSLEMVNEF